MTGKFSQVNGSILDMSASRGEETERSVLLKSVFSFNQKLITVYRISYIEPGQSQLMVIQLLTLTMAD